MDQNKKAQNEMASLGGEACFWASENNTQWVDFESHSPKWYMVCDVKI